MTNCYWIEELGAFEVCAESNLPPLPGDYVIWSDTPEVLAGRVHDYGYIPSQVNWCEVVASPDIITIAVNSGWESGPTWSSYMVVTSSDHGFTFSGGIDKYPFLAGTGEGYIATDYDGSFTKYYGTAIAYDEEGGEFIAIDNTKNDELVATSKMRISRSTDGVNWTTLLSYDENYLVTWCEAYNGTIWYVGHNLSYKWYLDPFYQEPRLVLRTSTDGGVTWTGSVIGNDTTYQATNGNFNKEDAGCSANAAGLHVINNAGDGYEFSLNYIRPTSNTTWAAPVVLWPIASEESLQGETDFILASRARPGEIYVGSVFNWPHEVHYRRSTDNGLTWSPAAVAWAPIAEFNIDMSNSNSSNGIQVVELDDGRLVLIMHGWHIPEYHSHFAYAVNTDGLATGFGATTILLPDGIEINSGEFSGFHPRFEATNKGNDVVLAWGNIGYAPNRTLVFRP